MSYIKHAIICAAGLGSRLGFNIPKSLVEINNKKIIDYQLDLLRDVPNVRIVVGFQKEKIISHVKKIRSDVTFIKNPYYATTSSSYSAYLGTREIKDPFLLLAGDLLIEPNSFHNFLEKCKSHKLLVGLTTTKTEHPIFVDLDQNKNIINFQRKHNTGFEWPCVCFFRKINFLKSNKYIFENLYPYLPVKSHIINCYEIDSKTDFIMASRNYNVTYPREIYDIGNTVI